MTETPAPKPQRHAPIALWRVAEAFLGVLYDLFGGPERIAFQHTLTKQPYQLLAAWLRAGEAMLRRLLIIEASAYPKPNTRALLHAKRMRVRKRVSFDDDKPETWRVSFRCFSTYRRLPAGRKRCRQDAGGTKFHAAWPLAERYEALIRVFNDPAPFARRLAAHMHATPHRLVEILKLPTRKRPRQSGEPADIPDLVGAESFAALTHAAESGGLCFNSS